MKPKNHPSIQLIKETFDINKTFSFNFASFDTIFKEIVSLDTKKAMHYNDALATIFKANADLFSIFINGFNESATSCKFLAVLKLADVTLVHKKSRFEKSHYLPVSLLQACRNVCVCVCVCGGGLGVYQKMLANLVS